MRRSLLQRRHPLLAALLLLTAIATSCVEPDPTEPPPKPLTRTLKLGTWTLGPDGASNDRASGFTDMAWPGEGEQDIAITAIRWHLLDGAGNEITNTDRRVHFHHVVAYSNKQADAACGGRQRFNAPGSERTDLELPAGTAYFVGRSDDWYANYDIMNLSDEPQEVTVTYDIEYTEDRTGLKDVTPHWMDLGGCRGVISVPGGGEPGSIYRASRTFTLPYPGQIVAVRGHFHAGGIDVSLTTTSGQLICRATGEYADGGGHGHEGEAGDDEHGHAPMGGTLVRIPLCTGLSFPVTAGQQVRVTVRYHNEMAMPDAMGSMLVYVAENRPPTPSTTRDATTTEPGPPAMAPGGH